MAILLAHYLLANLTPPTGKLVKFKDLPGGYAYESTFAKRANDPITRALGEKPYSLQTAAMALGCVKRDFGDCAVEVPALKGIPLTVIVYGADEFPSTTSILYDKSASSYLPTEDLAVLGELTAGRLMQAKKQV
ncbi:MAG: DUF3786 domain-containing protein [Candidatus Bathyarchaeota archaeon]|nr:DUF3786 domain-containing protein [Candidatus Bathyarchaeota archaeon]